MKKRLFATLLALVMALGLTATAWAADPVTSVEYVDADGTTKTCDTYTLVTDSGGSVTWNAGWYVVKGNVTIGNSSPNYGYLTVTGDVHLILCDGATLTVKGSVVGTGSLLDPIYGILLDTQAAASLTVYGQSGGTGTLDVSQAGFEYYSQHYKITPSGSVGIGLNGGSLTINGGHVMAGSQITRGGSTYGLCYGTLIMNGGKLTANSYGGGGNNNPIDDRINITIQSACCKWRTNGTGDYTAGSSIPKQFTSDANDKKYLEIVAGHEFGTWVDEVSATCTAPGTVAHKTCTLCGKDFDADGKEITDLTIPATGHHFVGRTCSDCGYTKPSTGGSTPVTTPATPEPETVGSPKTADPGVLLTSALSVVSLLGMGYVGKKR